MLPRAVEAASRRQHPSHRTSTSQPTLLRGDLPIATPPVTEICASICNMKGTVVAGGGELVIPWLAPLPLGTHRIFRLARCRASALVRATLAVPARRAGIKASTPPKPDQFAFCIHSPTFTSTHRTTTPAQSGLISIAKVRGWGLAHLRGLCMRPPRLYPAIRQLGLYLLKHYLFSGVGLPWLRGASTTRWLSSAPASG